MIDISSISIPDTSVVPEPDSVDFGFFERLGAQYATMDDGGKSVIRLLAFFARRCRDLEAEVERLKDELHGVRVALEDAEMGDDQ